MTDLRAGDRLVATEPGRYMQVVPAGVLSPTEDVHAHAPARYWMDVEAVEASGDVRYSSRYVGPFGDVLRAKCRALAARDEVEREIAGGHLRVERRRAGEVES